MVQGLVGLEFLKKNKIVDKCCDLEKPFAFLSYSHDEYDAQIVRNVFLKLYEKGYNLWIDIANIPYDENSWKDAATQALMSKGCKMAIFFRSESSMLKNTIKDELFMIKNLDYPIVTADIWKDNQLNAEEYKIKILREKDLNKFKTLSSICEIVEVDNSALRLSADLDNNINILVDEIALQLEKKEITPQCINETRKELNWEFFDSIKSFFYNGQYYNVSDAKNAYITIVDVIHQNDSSIQPNQMVECALPVYVKFDDGTELSIPKINFQNILENKIKDIKNKITLYAESVENGVPVKEYTILEREKKDDITPKVTPVTQQKTTVANVSNTDIPDTFTDSLADFSRYFNRLFDERNTAWKNANRQGRMPSIDMDLTVNFNLACLEHYSIREKSLKKMIFNVVEYFYQMSGERYFSQVVAVLRNGTSKYPLIVDDTYVGERKWYNRIQDSNYCMYNNYSAKEIFVYLNKHVELYFNYLQSEGISADANDVLVNYRFTNNEDAIMMQNIREQGDLVKSSTRSCQVTSEPLVSFAPESFVEFTKLFEKVSEERTIEYKEKNLGKAPSIPFSDIVLHLPENVAHVNEICADGWPELYAAVIDTLYDATNGEYCKMRTEMELQKNIRLPKIITKEYYDEFDAKAKSNYKLCSNGKYYYYKTYRAYNILKEGIRKELDIYMNFFADSRGIQDDVTSVKISYKLPESFAELFR